MNHRTLTIAATIALLGFTSCSAQQRRIVENLTEDPTPAEVVVVADLEGDPAIQGSCLPGEDEVNGTCLPQGVTNPPPTQPPQTGFSCPAGEVIDVDPSPHCVIG